MSTPWLTIVGIGEDGLEGLSATARAHVTGADVLIGGKRHLAMVPETGCERMTWPSPFSALTEQIEALKGRKVCVLATGDPMHFGVGVRLAAHFPASEISILPAPSAFSLAAARMGWALQNVDCLSLHGRASSRLNAALAPGQKIIALTSSGQSPAAIAGLLKAAGYTRSSMTIFEHMGGSDEARHDVTAENITGDYAPLNTIAMTCVADEGLSALPPIAGLPDDAFVHDGTMTKRDIRASALAKLSPLPGQLLWDVGAGAGSIAIEWMRAARGAQAIAFEKNQKRLAMIASNADRLGAPDLEIIAGVLPITLISQPRPDALFIGGGLQTDGLFEACWQALKPSGRLVAHAVTLASEARLIELFQTYGGDLTRLDISHATALGPTRGWTPSRPVTQWSVAKPLDTSP